MTPWSIWSGRRVHLRRKRLSFAASICRRFMRRFGRGVSGLAHLVYVSVAHPAPMMHAYIEVRSEGESTIARAGLTATVVRPWYVLGPGHWWPIVLIPLYALCELVPSTRATARRLGLVTIGQMVRALVNAVEHPPPRGRVHVVEVPEIRRRVRLSWAP